MQYNYNVLYKQFRVINLNILIYGSSGKLGSAIYNTGVKEGCCVLAGNSRSYEPIPANIDVAIEATTAIAIPNLAKAAYDAKKPLVICSSGLDESILQTLHDFSKEIPLFISSNMSIGVNIVKNIVEKAAKELIKFNFDIEIIEKHHNQKIDAPSGTAITLKKAIEPHINKDIPVHSIRAGSIFGEHSVIFAGSGEIIEISHTALNREIFSIGAIKAAKFIKNKPPGIYGMDSLLNT